MRFRIVPHPHRQSSTTGPTGGLGLVVGRASYRASAAGPGGPPAKRNMKNRSVEPQEWQVHVRMRDLARSWMCHLTSSSEPE